MSGKNRKPKKPDARKISKKLKPRQRKFIAYYTDPTKDTFGNATKSAIAAGYSKKSARFIASENLTKPNIQSEIAGVMDELGATVQHGITRLKEGMDAKEVKVFHTKDGEIVYSKPLVALQERRLATEQMFRLRGLFPTNREQDRISGLIFQQNIVIVPGGLPEPEEKVKKVRQLTD